MSESGGQSDRDELLGELAVEHGYVTQEQLDEALDIWRRLRVEMGLDQTLAQVLAGKHYLTPDQAQELGNEVAIRTGEARFVAG